MRRVRSTGRGGTFEEILPRPAESVTVENVREGAGRWRASPWRRRARYAGVTRQIPTLRRRRRSALTHDFAPTLQPSFQRDSRARVCVYTARHARSWSARRLRDRFLHSAGADRLDGLQHRLFAAVAAPSALQPAAVSSRSIEGVRLAVQRSRLQGSPYEHGRHRSRPSCGDQLMEASERSPSRRRRANGTRIRRAIGRIAVSPWSLAVSLHRSTFPPHLNRR